MGLSDLACRDESGVFRVVVEVPRGSRVKLKYEPKDAVFTFDRALATGLAYPYDWGFIPGTMADDGDPIDAMVLGDEPTWPGVVIPAKLIGMIRLSQRPLGKRTRQRNDRIVAARADDVRRYGERRLPRKQLEQLEEFFIAASKLPRDRLNVEGWSGARAARDAILVGERRYRESKP